MKRLPDNFIAGDEMQTESSVTNTRANIDRLSLREVVKSVNPEVRRAINETRKVIGLDEIN